MKLIKAIFGGLGIVFGWIGISIAGITLFAGVVGGIIWLGSLVGITEKGFGYFILIAFALILVGSFIGGIITAARNVYRYGFKRAWKKSWQA